MSTRHLLLVCVVCAVTTACHRSKVEPATKRSSAAVPSASTEPAYKPGPKPTEAELREVITRNYKDAVTIDNSQSIPFLIGDFNGDGSEDIAIIVKPGAGKLSELNSEYANWILEDPHHVDFQQQKSPPRPVSVQRNDLLLAVIHGHEREGWRNALATQTYLLRHAVGKEFETQSARQMGAGNGRSVPVLKGDVIRQNLDGTARNNLLDGRQVCLAPGELIDHRRYLPMNVSCFSTRYCR